MGMFDDLVMEDADMKVMCGEGHELNDTVFQTKDLMSTMNRYYIKGDMLYLSKYDNNLNDYVAPVPVDYTGQINFYSHCSKCPKIKWQKKGEHVQNWHPMTSQPWVEYTLLMWEGHIIKHKAHDLETMAEHKARMVGFDWEELIND